MIFLDVEFSQEDFFDGLPIENRKLSFLFDHLEDLSSLGLIFDFSNVNSNNLDNYYAIDCDTHIKFITEDEIVQEREVECEFGRAWLKAISKESKEWVKNKLYFIINNKTLSMEKDILPIMRKSSHIIDYLNSFDDEEHYIKETFQENESLKKEKLLLLSRERSKSQKLSLDDAYLLANTWVDKLKKRASEEEDYAGIEEVYSIGDYKFLRVFSKKALEREGFIMNHCVASYYNYDSHIYSLRDKNNQPLVTFECDLDNKIISQIKGKHNAEVPVEHVENCIAFIDNYLSVRLNNSHLDGLENHISKIGFTKANNSSYYAHTPKYDILKIIPKYENLTHIDITSFYGLTEEEFYKNTGKGKLSNFINDYFEFSSLGYSVFKEHKESLEQFLNSITEYNKKDDFLKVLCESKKLRNPKKMEDKFYIGLFEGFYKENYPIEMLNNLVKNKETEKYNQELKRLMKIEIDLDITTPTLTRLSPYYSKDNLYEIKDVWYLRLLQKTNPLIKLHEMIKNISKHQEYIYYLKKESEYYAHEEFENGGYSHCVGIDIMDLTESCLDIHYFLSETVSCIAKETCNLDEYEIKEFSDKLYKDIKKSFKNHTLSSFYETFDRFKYASARYGFEGYDYELISELWAVGEEFHNLFYSNKKKTFRRVYSDLTKKISKLA